MSDYSDDYLKATIRTDNFETVLSNIDYVLTNILGVEGLEILQDAYLKKEEADGEAVSAVNNQLSKLDLSTQETVSNLLAIKEVIRQYKEIITGVANGSRIKLTDTLINVDIEELYKVINEPEGVKDLLDKQNLGNIINESQGYDTWIANYTNTLGNGLFHKTLDENGDVGYVSDKQEDMDRERIFNHNVGEVKYVHQELDRKLARAYTTATVLEELVDIMHGDLKSLDDIFDHFNLDEIDDMNSFDAFYTLSEGENGSLEVGLSHEDIDTLGLIPVVGEVFDAYNFFWYLSEGNPKGMVGSGVGLIPIVGELKGLKYVDEAEEIVEDVVKYGDEAEEVVEDVAKNGDDVVEDVGKNADEVAEGVGKISSNDITFNESSVDKSFSKHSSDFGEYPDGSNSSKSLYENDLKNFIDDPNNIQKSGTYRGQSGTHIYDEESHLWIFINEDGSYNTGFKLNDSQYENLINRGSI